MYKDYNMNQITLPLDLEVLIPEDDIALAVNTLVESIPETEFEALLADSVRMRWLAQNQRPSYRTISGNLPTGCG